jgi:RNA polymerase sigma-70 factor (ECF subfamily)
MDAMTDDLPVAGPDAESEFSRLGAGEWRALFSDLAAGSPEAFASLYDVSASRIFGLALWRTGSPEDAGDVLHDLFVRVASQRNRLRRVRNPRAWLLTVARRLAVDAVRRRKRAEADSVEDCPFLEAPAGDATRTLDAQRASALLARLPAAQREAIYLHHHAGCTFAAIGEIAGVPTFTAASRYRLGIAKLRRLMEGKE